MADFNGIVGIFSKNLDTGQEVVINGDVAYAGMSILKVPIMIETYRWLNREPDEETAKLLRETMITSGNFTANLLLRLIGYSTGRRDSAFAGVEVLNASLKRLGLVNTFMATPYDTEAPAPALCHAGQLAHRPDHRARPVHADHASGCRSPAGDGVPALQGRRHAGRGLSRAIHRRGRSGHGRPDAPEPRGHAPRRRPARGRRLAHKHGYVADTHADAAIVLDPRGRLYPGRLYLLRGRVARPAQPAHLWRHCHGVVQLLSTWTRRTFAPIWRQE